MEFVIGFAIGCGLVCAVLGTVWLLASYATAIRELDAARNTAERLRKELVAAEKMGVEEGLFDLEDCGYYTGEEDEADAD